MKNQNPSYIDPVSLKKWLHDGNEIALIDVREHGQYGEEHLFYVVSVPYSKLESDVSRLVPRKQVRMVLVGDEEGALSLKAFKRLLKRAMKFLRV
jgi:rhodanese-related sulfurtransferase